MSHQDNSNNELQSFCLHQEKRDKYHNESKKHNALIYTFLFKILHTLKISWLVNFVEGHFVNIQVKIVFNFEHWFQSGCFKFLNLAAMFLINQLYFCRSHTIYVKYFKLRRLLMFTGSQ